MHGSAGSGRPGVVLAAVERRSFGRVMGIGRERIISGVSVSFAVESKQKSEFCFK